MTFKPTIDLPQIDNYRSLFLNDTPLLDVRAPVEFDQGAFPGAENIPLMNNQERTEIGIRYKNNGQEEAIKLGQELIQGKVKSDRVDNWEKYIQQHPQGILYCFRGGMRSKITQQWIYDQTGIVYPRVDGGYKALRRYLIDELEVSTQSINPLILGGRTGTGKTIVLNKIANKIDLEGLFHHRGSVFGKHVTPQPTQINIENILSIELIKHLHKDQKNIVLEDEGGNIGSRRLPECLIKKMKQSPVIILEENIDERINITYQEYVTEALAEYQSFYREELGHQKWTEQLHESIDKIQRRLGGVRYKQLKSQLTDAIQQQKNGNEENFKDWIKVLLVDYYDPMYDYQLSKKQERVIFKGNKNEVLHYFINKSK
ncbi:MAG: tRNA 2-selenouridine(34) synthase MnmH [Woeseiaceae bacterium]